MTRSQSLNLTETTTMTSQNESTEAVHLSISAGAPSEHYTAEERTENCARDYDVTMTIGGERVVEGAITLFRDAINGGMSPCGAPISGWISREILVALEALPESVRRATIAALAALSDGEVRS
jgi:hypothetical protein